MFIFQNVNVCDIINHMESQRNNELPIIQGEFSNGQFENHNFDRSSNYEDNLSAQNIDKIKSREAAFSAYEEPFIQPQANIPNPILPATRDDMGSISNSVPSVAADIDLMENEWVEDLKKMIVETKGDPYVREEKFKKMQLDYLIKRYNRSIGGKK